MKRPATATIGVFLAVILVAAAVAAFLLLGTDGAPAIEVGEATVARESLNDELREWAEFQPDQFRTTAGAVRSTASASIATQIVWEHLAAAYLDRQGEKVTADDRASARDQVRGARFGTLPQWFQERYLDRIATFAAITRLEGDPDDPRAELRVLRREARRTEVTVDPVYGRWAAAKTRVLPYRLPAVAASGS